MSIKEEFTVLIERLMIAYDEETRVLGSHLKLHNNRYSHHNRDKAKIMKLNIKRS